MSEEKQTPQSLIIAEEVVSKTRTQLMNAIDRLMMLDTTSPVFKRLTKIRYEFIAKISAAVAETGLESEQAVIDSGKYPHIVEALAKRQNLDDAFGEASTAMADAQKIVDDFFVV